MHHTRNPLTRQQAARQSAPVPGPGGMAALSDAWLAGTSRSEGTGRIGPEGSTALRRYVYGTRGGHPFSFASSLAAPNIARGVSLMGVMGRSTGPMGVDGSGPLMQEKVRRPGVVVVLWRAVVWWCLGVEWCVGAFGAVLACVRWGLFSPAVPGGACRGRGCGGACGGAGGGAALARL